MACPLNAIVLPTAQLRELVGESIVTVGATEPGETTIVVAPMSPLNESVTRSPTVTDPGLVYVQDGVGEAESTKVPLPSRSQA